MKKQGLIKNFIKNKDYIFYYAKVLLKSRVAGSYLGFLWLFIDPLMFMLIYSFVVQFIFNSSMPNFNLFVFVGITTWKLISGTILNGPTAIVRNKDIFEQVYFHKFVYPTIYLLVNLYEFLIANSLILILMATAGISFTWHILEFIPITFVAFCFTYGITLIVSHLGVYFFDLRNILDFTLKFVFYLSPIMWSYEMIHHSWVNLLKINPVSIIIQSYRNIFFYGISPNYVALGCLLLVSFIVIKVGYGLLNKYEDEYGRII